MVLCVVEKLLLKKKSLIEPTVLTVYQIQINVKRPVLYCSNHAEVSRKLSLITFILYN